jgi:hypothetical protein
MYDAIALARNSNDATPRQVGVVGLCSLAGDLLIAYIDDAHAAGETEHGRFWMACKARLNPAAMLFNFSTIGNRRVGTQMRIPLVGCVLLAAIQPSFAQTRLTTEPLILDPYTVVFVNDGSCSAGKILKVTGAIRGLHRKKSCMPASEVSES